MGGTSLAPPTVDAGLLAILNADIQDEYRAEAIYRGVLLDFGSETLNNHLPAFQRCQ